MFGNILDFVVSIYTVILCRLHRIFCGLDYENVALTITSAMIYNAVFYKNSAFSEEQEYRFVYYPFGLIRNLLVSHKSKDMAANQLFYDRMHDTLMDAMSEFSIL